MSIIYYKTLPMSKARTTTPVVHGLKSMVIVVVIQLSTNLVVSISYITNKNIKSAVNNLCYP